jgi:hypothetical protein
MKYKPEMYITIKGEKYRLPNGLRSKRNETLGTEMIFGFERYFNKRVWVANIRHNPIECIKPTHGYFYPHPIGKKLKNWCKKNNIEFNND